MKWKEWNRPQRLLHHPRQTPWLYLPLSEASANRQTAGWGNSREHSFSLHALGYHFQESYQENSHECWLQSGGKNHALPKTGDRKRLHSEAKSKIWQGKKSCWLCKFYPTDSAQWVRAPPPSLTRGEGYCTSWYRFSHTLCTFPEWLLCPQVAHKVPEFSTYRQWQ